jgi:hypothetical protein
MIRCRQYTYFAVNALILPFITGTLPFVKAQAPFIPVFIQACLPAIYLYVFKVNGASLPCNMNHHTEFLFARFRQRVKPPEVHLN